MTNLPSQATIQLRAARRAIGKNIHHYRTASNITLRKLGLLTRISINDLDMFELGKGKLGIENLAKIAEALQVDLVILMNTKR